MDNAHYSPISIFLFPRHVVRLYPSPPPPHPPHSPILTWLNSGQWLSRTSRLSSLSSFWKNTNPIQEAPPLHRNLITSGNLCVLACSVTKSCQPHGAPCSPPGSSVHGILQAITLEWVAISSSRGSSWPRDQTPVSDVSCIDSQILYNWVTRGYTSKYLCLIN